MVNYWKESYIKDRWYITEEGSFNSASLERPIQDLLMYYSLAPNLSTGILSTLYKNKDTWFTSGTITLIDLLDHRNLKLMNDVDQNGFFLYQEIIDSTYSLKEQKEPENKRVTFACDDWIRENAT